jgi:hypothetical protein
VRAGPDIEILGLSTEKQIPNPAPYDVGGVIVLVEAVEHLEGVGIDVPPRDPVLLARDDDGQGHGGRL